jgi:transposase
MPHYVGLDASKATTSICIMNEDGERIREGVVETEPRAIVGFLRGGGLRYRRVGIESTSFTPWLYEGLVKARLPVICIEAQHARSLLKARRNKTDRNDARGIAEVMRAGIYKAVHVKTDASREAMLVLAARRHLIRKCRDIDNLIRGALLQSGRKIAPGRVYDFDQRAESMARSEGVLRDVLDTLLVARRAVASQADVLDRRATEIAAGDPACRRFMTVPGVGPIVALSFRVAIDVPERFARSRDVGVHLGLTPRSHQSGAVDRKGRISRSGDVNARTALVLAAKSVVRARTRSTTLKTWGLRVISARGYSKGVVAVARKLAVTLHRMWVNETDYQGGPIAA